MFFAWWILHLFWILHLYIIKLSDTDIEISLPVRYKMLQDFHICKIKIEYESFTHYFLPL